MQKDPKIGDPTSFKAPQEEGRKPPEPSPSTRVHLRFGWFEKQFWPNIH